jgi:hypothetical protein
VDKERKNRWLLKGVEIMEQTGNNGMAATDLPCDIIGRGNSRETERSGKEGNVLTGTVETKSDARLKKSFRLTSNTSNAGFIEWCVLVVTMLLCLSLWKVTGVQWLLFAGTASLLLAVPGIILAFAAETVTQVVRLIAKLAGKGRDFFREEEKECSLSKAAAECYGFVKRVFNQDRNEAKCGYNRHEVKDTLNRRAGNNARSYRRASRPAFAHSSGDGGDDSGDSDSGDPPEPSRHTAQPQLKLSQIFYSKSNKFSYPWRFQRAFGCWRLPCRKCAVRRWAV